MTTREQWREVIRLKVRGDNGRVPEDWEIAQRAGYRVRSLAHLYARPEFREMLAAEEAQVREEIRAAATARVLHALRTPGEKDDVTRLALTVWDKLRRDGEENGCGLGRQGAAGEGECEANGCGATEARLEKLSDQELAALAALAAGADPFQPADPPGAEQGRPQGPGAA